jgi:hypothetical protein
MPKKILGAEQTVMMLRQIEVMKGQCKSLGAVCSGSKAEFHTEPLLGMAWICLPWLLAQCGSPVMT